MIITGVAERAPERLTQLVYLDALVPADGEDAYDAEGSSDEVRGADRAAAQAAGCARFPRRRSLPGVAPVADARSD